MTIEVDIPAIGKKPGTVGWLLEYLEQSEVRTTTNTDGETCAFLYPPSESGDGLSDDGIFLVKPAASLATPPEYDTVKTRGQTFLRTNITGNPRYEVRWFDIALTPAAEKRAEEFLDEVTEAFAEQWVSDEVPA